MRPSTRKDPAMVFNRIKGHLGARWQSVSFQVGPERLPFFGCRTEELWCCGNVRPPP